MAGTKGMLREGRTITWTHHPEYNRWQNMLKRCQKPWHPKFPEYGGRGIAVCEAWENFEVFLADLETLGPCPEGCSLDRIDNGGDYEPGNVRWAPSTDQNLNKRPYRARTKAPSHAKTVVVLDGAEITIAKAAEILGVQSSSLKKRLARMRKSNPDMARKVSLEQLSG